MLFYALTGLANAITSTLLGSFVYFKNRKAKVNQVFSLFCLSVAIWGYGYYFWQIANNADSALFWSRVFMLGAIFIPITYFHFILNLLNRIKEKKKILIVGYVFFFIFLLFNATPLFVKNVASKLSFNFWPEPGIIFHPFLLIWFLYAFYTIYLLILEYRHLRGLQRSQVKYILLGTIIGYLGGTTNYFLWYDIPIPPIGSWSATLYLGIVAYSIIKYRLMDIRVAVKRSTIFSGVVIAVTMLYALVAFLSGLAAFGGGYTFKSQLITGLIVAVAVAFGFRPLYEWLKRTTDAFLFKGEYRPEELMADITDILSRTLEMDKIIQTVKEKVKKALRVGEMEVVVLEEATLRQAQGIITKNQELRMVSTQKTSHGIVSSSPSATPHNDGFKKIINYFKDQREVLVLEELQRRYADRTKFDKSFLLIKEMEKLKAALLVPLFLKEKLVGLFLLGTKKSGDMFTNEDIKTMETVASQAAIAIENSRLYEEMKDFSKTLQKEVERQTKTLREANIKLEQLDKAKSEFISIASHQLRTPLSIIKGYISMLLEGLWGEVSQEQKRHLEMVYISNERMIKLIEDLLMLSRIEAGRLEFEWQMISLEGLAENVVEELKPLADKKGLYLRYEKPLKPLPKVKADPLKIRQVLMNLIDNAIHYTEKGGAAVRLKSEKDKVIFSIQDTGIGISAKDKAALFEKFSRGKGISKLHTEGTGLGLYLAAKLVEAHGGKIWVESEGEGKGSVFCFELGGSLKNLT